MKTPDNDAVFVKQSGFYFVCFILGFLQPVLMVAMVPEQSFMYDDQIGALHGCLSDDVDSSPAGSNDAGTGLSGIAVQDLIPGGLFIDDFIVPDTSAVVFEISDDCADLHMYAFFLKQLLKEQVFDQDLGSDHDENDTAQDAGIAF